MLKLFFTHDLLESLKKSYQRLTMNFLAHLFLSCNDESLLIGNFIADAIRNRDLKQYSKAIQSGVLLHRKIDSYTDNHPIIRKGTKRLRPQHRKYAAVVIDVFYDYLLIKNWERYSQQSLTDFTQQVYKSLSHHQHLLPTQLRDNLPRMIQKDWLKQYGHLDGIAYTFRRMEQRVSQPHLLLNTTQSLQRDEALLMKEFNLFFPDVIAMVEAECTC